MATLFALPPRKGFFVSTFPGKPPYSPLNLRKLIVLSEPSDVCSKPLRTLAKDDFAGFQFPLSRLVPPPRPRPGP